MRTNCHLHIDGGGVLHHSLHHSTDVSWLDGVHPVSCFHALSQHLGDDQTLNLQETKVGDLSCIDVSVFPQ